MSRRTIALTTSWQVISGLKAVITISKTPGTLPGQVFFNTTDSDVGAQGFTRGALGMQINQHNDENTYARATKAGWEVIVSD